MPDPRSRTESPTQPMTETAAHPRDLFGDRPAATTQFPQPPKPTRKRAVAAPSPTTQPPATAAEGGRRGLPALRGLTTEDIESWKAMNVAVCLRSPSLGEVWVVPHYTGLPRKELTAEHVATLSRFMALFPGAELAGFDLPPQPATGEVARASSSPCALPAPPCAADSHGHP